MLYFQQKRYNMKNDIKILQMSPLFTGVNEQDMEEMISCLDGQMKTYGKNERILTEAETLKKVGVILKGCVQVENEDVFGNRNIQEMLEPGELFGAAYACAGIKNSPVSITSISESKVLFLEAGRILSVCPTACPFHQKMVENMVYILARKNVMLSEKIGHISKRSTREKLLSYLSSQSKKAGSRHFFIPFNRQELADYLCVERSAMSAELSKLRGEGLLDYKKFEFWLYGQD